MSEVKAEDVARVIIREANRLIPQQPVALYEQVIKPGTSDYLPKLQVFAGKIKALGIEIANTGAVIEIKQKSPTPSNEARYLEWTSFHLSNAEDALENALKMLEKLSGYMNTSMSLGELLEEADVPVSGYKDSRWHIKPYLIEGEIWQLGTSVRS